MATPSLQTAPLLPGTDGFPGLPGLLVGGAGPLHEVTRGPRLVGALLGPSCGFHVEVDLQPQMGQRQRRGLGRDLHRPDWGAGSHHFCPHFIARIRQLESQLCSELLWKDLLSLFTPLLPGQEAGLRGLHQRAPLSCASAVGVVGCRGGECGLAPQPPPALSCHGWLCS